MFDTWKKATVKVGGVSWLLSSRELSVPGTLPHSLLKAGERSLFCTLEPHGHITMGNFEKEARLAWMKWTKSKQKSSMVGNVQPPLQSHVDPDNCQDLWYKKSIHYTKRSSNPNPQPACGVTGKKALVGWERFADCLLWAWSALGSKGLGIKKKWPSSQVVPSLEEKTDDKPTVNVHRVMSVMTGKYQEHRRWEPREQHIP